VPYLDRMLLRIYDVNGNVLSTSAAGLDPEGLVAMADGTFWVSDEYGPYIVHFDATGKEISRLDPYSTAMSGNNLPLPGELKKRKPNKGMEGLTLTPDGKYLVGIMQSSLDKSRWTRTAPPRSPLARVRSRASSRSRFPTRSTTCMSTSIRCTPTAPATRRAKP
jgi:hypothetical protein